MKKKEVIKYYGGVQQRVCEALKISKGAVSRWGETVPERIAARLDRLTNGDLRYDPKHYKKKS